MTEKEIKSLINSEIIKFNNDNLDKEVSKVLHGRGKSRDEMVDTIRNAFDSVYKVLWQKKDFWKTDIK